jgi:hypothetical protein
MAPRTRRSTTAGNPQVANPSDENQLQFTVATQGCTAGVDQDTCNTDEKGLGLDSQMFGPVLLVLESTSTCHRYVCVSPAIEQVLTHLRCDCRLTTTPQLLTHFCVTPVFHLKDL